MFTGIVKALAPVSALSQKEALLTYGIELPKMLLEGLELGASVAVDGACQTVVKIEGQIVWFEAIDETLRCTTLRDLTVGQRVNIERSLCFGDELGGHLLSGHVFGRAKIVNIEENCFTFACQKEWTKYLFKKGFIAVDGVSLTLASVDPSKGEFTVHLIPETLKRTTLGFKRCGDRVNLEFDPLTQAVVTTTERLQAHKIGK